MMVGMMMVVVVVITAIAIGAAYNYLCRLHRLRLCRTSCNARIVRFQSG